MPKKVSPTSDDRGRKDQVGDPGIREAKAPEIFVRLASSHSWKDHDFARAHLRNRGGYLYLVWREGKHVRSFYLGKRRNRDLQFPSSAGAGGPRS
jgi:hypothetical protein